MTTLRSSDTKDRPQAVFPSAGLFLGPGQAGDLHRENVKVPAHSRCIRWSHRFLLKSLTSV